MTRSAYWLRALLYMALAALPIVIAGIEHGTVRILIILNAVYQSGLALRAFVDKSPAEVVETKEENPHDF